MKAPLCKTIESILAAMKKVRPTSYTPSTEHKEDWYVHTRNLCLSFSKPLSKPISSPDQNHPWPCMLTLPDTALKQMHNMVADENNLLVHFCWLMSHILPEHDTWVFPTFLFCKPVARPPVQFHHAEPLNRPAYSLSMCRHNSGGVGKEVWVKEPHVRLPAHRNRVKYISCEALQRCNATFTYIALTLHILKLHY